MHPDLPSQVLALDIDGTLLDQPLDFEAPISDANLAALKDLVASGTRLLISTGRNESSCLSVLERSGWDYLLECDRILQNGVIVKTAAGRVIAHNELDRREAVRALDVYRAHGLCTMLFESYERGGACLMEIEPAHPRLCKYLEMRRRENPAPDALRLVPDLSAHLDRDITALGSIDTAERSAAACADIEALGLKLSHAAKLKLVHRPGYADGVFLELFSSKVGKHLAFASYCEEMGFDPARCAAIGDGGNDLELLKMVGAGIAMGNASEDVKEAADHVAPHYTENGVATAIREHLLP